MSNKIKRMILGQGFGKIIYPQELHSAVQRVVKAWSAFCNQSINHKELIPFEKNGGYENKDRRITANSRDHKEDFHITRDYELPSSFNAKRVDVQLIDAGKYFFEAVKPNLIYIAHSLSEATGTDFVRLAVENENGWVLRLLHYYPGNTDRIPAHDHYDKGGHTIHLFDSTPGFERYWQNEWRPLRFKENEMAFFMGLLGQLEARCELKALSHRVVSTPQIVRNGRVSLVLFNDYPNSLFAYDREKFGPVQSTFTPGMADNISYDTLKGYFKERTSQDAR